jgi:predicted DNA-binding protein (UPF0251 family)
MDFQPSHRYRAQIRDPEADDQVTAIDTLSCEEAGYVPVRLAYDTLAHERVAGIELLPEEESTGYAYCSGVRTLQYESLGARMGFVLNTTRFKAREIAKKRKRTAVEIGTDDMSTIPSRSGSSSAPAAAARIDMSEIEKVALRSIKSLAPELQDQLRQHYVHGLSWASIAARYNVTAESVRQDASRALKKIAKAIVDKQSGATEGAVGRLVEWLHELLDRIR